MIISASDSATSKPIEYGIKGEVERLCGDGCTTMTVDAPIAQWPDLTTRIQSVLRDNPDVTYVLPVFDGMVLYLVPGIHAGGFQDKVKIGSFNGSPDVMQLLKDGDVVGAEVGGAILWEGWGFADQALRILTDNPPVEDIKTPLRLFTAENINEIDLEAQESTWYGDVDFKAEYQKLWGVD
jgi:ribose transport system substrate-binding protein